MSELLFNHMFVFDARSPEGKCARCGAAYGSMHWFYVEFEDISSLRQLCELLCPDRRKISAALERKP